MVSRTKKGKRLNEKEDSKDESLHVCSSLILFIAKNLNKEKISTLKIVYWACDLSVSWTRWENI